MRSIMHSGLVGLSGVAVRPQVGRELSLIGGVPTAQSTLNITVQGVAMEAVQKRPNSEQTFDKHLLRGGLSPDLGGDIEGSNTRLITIFFLSFQT